MDKRILTTLAVSALIALPLPAYAQAPDYAALRDAALSDHIKPGYAHFDEKAKGLDYKIKGHCKNVGEAPDKLAAQDAFHGALDAWQAVQHIRHGAVAENDRHSRLQFWPDQRGITERHMRKILAEPVDATITDNFADASVALQGFPALERLLFDDAPLSQHLIDGEKTSRCVLAQAIAHNIASIAAELKNAGPRPGDAKTFVTDTVNDLVVGIEFIQSLKLKLPAGARKPRPFLLENWRAKRSLRNIEINIRALRELYKLLAADLVDSDEKIAQILDAFEKVEDDVRALGENAKIVLEEEDGPKRLRALSARIEQLRDGIVATLPKSLGVRLGFNSLDGD
ncbi:MAG: imelysin family protein [Rhodospirillales bacterium]|nr:imelysin family protein [Rhodospirillales bacterium]